MCIFLVNNKGITIMYIYTSTKAMPYVYRCEHKETKEIYYGSRYANKTPSSEDFPKYRTSSKKVKPKFEEFDWVIVAEFFKSDDAYDFEQQLIHEEWDNPLLLNGNCFYEKMRWTYTGGSKKGHGKGRKSPKHSLYMKGKGERGELYMQTKEAKAIMSASTSNRNKIAVVSGTHPMQNVENRLNQSKVAKNTTQIRKNRNIVGILKNLSFLTNTKLGTGWWLKDDSWIQENISRLEQLPLFKYKEPIRPTVTCPHCNLTGGIGGMKRYHFDNCKIKLK